MDTYDAWNRLITVAHAYRDSGGTLQTGHVFDTLSYDAAGRRIVKAISGTGLMDFTYHDYYSGQSVIEEQNGSGVTIKQQAWGLAYVDELLQTSLNGSPLSGSTVCDTPYWVCQDANYNVLGVVDSGGTLTERYEYSAYGQRQVFASTGSNDPGCYAASFISQRFWDNITFYYMPYGLNDFGHQGLRYDEESGLIYNRARMIQPTFGRFMQSDPDGYVDGLDFYQAYQNNPNNRVDPLGTVALHFDAFIPKGLGKPNGLYGAGEWAPEPYQSLTNIQVNPWTIYSDWYFQTDDRTFGEAGSSRLFSDGNVSVEDIGNLKPKKPFFTSKTSGSQRARYVTTSDWLGGNTRTYVERSGVMFADVHQDETVQDLGPCESKIILHAWAAYPFHNGPSIDYYTYWDLVKSNSNVKVSLWVEHNNFPDYEGIVNGELIYKYDAVAGGETGPGFWNLTTTTTGEGTYP